MIPKIHNTNYDRILTETLSLEDKSGVVENVRNVMTLMPHKSLIISRFINDLMKADSNLKDDIMKMIDGVINSNDANIIISSSFSMKRLGIDCSFDWIGDISSLDGSLLNGMSVTSPSSDVLEECRGKISKILSIINKEEFEEVFCITQIIRNFRFSTQECVDQLEFVSEWSRIVKSIRIVHEEENPIYLSSLIIEFSKKQGFLHLLLDDLQFLDSECRNTILALLFEYFYNPGKEDSVYASTSYVPLDSDDEIKSFLNLINDDTMRMMRRISGISKTQRFIPDMTDRVNEIRIKRISRDEFERIDSNDRNAFFRNFCYLGSPSISHFLTYLEIYKNDFALSKEDQELFLSIFLEIFKDSESFSRIVMGKMRMFKIIECDS